MYLTKLHRIKRTFGVSMLLAATFFCQSCNSFLDVDVRHAASENQQWRHLRYSCGIDGSLGLRKICIGRK